MSRIEKAVYYRDPDYPYPVIITTLKKQLSTSDWEKFAESIAQLRRYMPPLVECRLDENNQPVIVTEPIKGNTLREALNQSLHKRFSPNVVLSYLQQMADALELAEENKIRLCLNPNNLWIEQQGKLKFEIERDEGTWREAYQEAEKLPAADYRYSSPQIPQSSSSRLTLADVQYIAGLFAYEMLTGTFPFAGNYQTVIASHINKLPPIPKHVPRIIADVILKALAKEPGERYLSLQDFTLEFEQACQQGRLVRWTYAFSKRLDATKLPGTHALASLLDQWVHKQQHKTNRAFQKNRRETVVKIGMTAAAAIAIMTGGGVLITHTSNHSKKQVSRPGLSSRPTAGPSRATLLLKYQGHSSPVTSVAFSPDGHWLASGDESGKIHLLDLASKRLLKYHWHKASITGLSWFAGQLGELYLVSTDIAGFASLWYLHGSTLTSYPLGDTLKTAFEGAIYAINGSPSGEHLVMATNSTLVAFDSPLENGFTTTDGPYDGHKDVINALACAPDPLTAQQKRFASGSRDMTVKLWDIYGKQPLIYTFSHHTQEVMSVAWSHEEDLIASSGADEQVLIWSAKQDSIGTVHLTYTEHTAAVNSVAWRPGDKFLASGSDDDSVHIFDLTGQKRFSYMHNNDVNSVAWSSDGRLLASASADKVVQVWQINF